MDIHNIYRGLIQEWMTDIRRGHADVSISLSDIYYSLRFNRVFMYIYIYFFLFQCKGISKLLLRLSKLTYYNCFFFFLFCLYHVCYMLYMSVLKTMYYVHVWNKICSILFCSDMNVFVLFIRLSVVHAKFILQLYILQRFYIFTILGSLWWV